MPTSVEALEAEVLRLSLADRAHLISSLDTDAEIDAAWDAVADVREAGLDSGNIAPMPLEEAVARLKARLPG